IRKTAFAIAASWRGAPWHCCRRNWNPKRTRRYRVGHVGRSRFSCRLDPADPASGKKAREINGKISSADDDASLRAARLYFRIDPMGQRAGAMEPWARGEAPRLDDAQIAASNSANVKLAAVPPVPFPAGEPGSVFDAPVERADLPP